MVAIPYRQRDGLKSRDQKNIAEYEKYLDKFSKAAESEVVRDIQALLPDGAWPVYNISAEMLRPFMGGKLKIEGAARIGGSLFSLEPDEVSKVYIVITEPKNIWLRRMSFRLQTRSLDVKYAGDRSYMNAMQMQFKDWAAVPKKMEDDFNMFRSYISNCIYKFGDKVEFIDGNSDKLVFNKAGAEVTLANGAAFKHPMAGRIPEEMQLRPFTSSEYEGVRTAWAETQPLLNGLKPTSMSFKTPVPNAWFCTRTQETANVNVCLGCLSTMGESVMPNAKPGWDKEPCAYEVAYGPGPYKTIEESVTNHSWGVLP